ncbi:MAG TPA: DNA polymerase III subunit delta' [Smithella sp.]|nr:DNA polymerase III subunit delta' [Smithella sp.]HRS97461.1 DNA polymerase III subunit delta' [Smithella sp.]
MSFHDISGHQKIIEILRRTLIQGRIAQAYLFSGISAIGKRTLARELIKAVNCEEPNATGDPCDRCLSCRKITQNIHPDVFVVEAEGQFIRIGAVREIQARVTCRPLEAKRRAFIIDDADKMREEAANALLKILEEPSPSNMFVLVSARPYALPQTIISRCQHLRFNPLTDETVAKILTEITASQEEKKEGKSGKTMKMDPQKALLLSALAGGSVERALELNREEIDLYRDELIRLLSTTTRENVFSMLQLASFLAQGKKEIRHGLNILKTFFRDILIFKETQKNSMLINQDKSSVVAVFAERLDGEQILQNIARIENAGEIMERNVNKLLTLETMAFNLNY